MLLHSEQKGNNVLVQKFKIRFVFCRYTCSKHITAWFCGKLQFLNLTNTRATDFLGMRFEAGFRIIVYNFMIIVRRYTM